MSRYPIRTKALGTTKSSSNPTLFIYPLEGKPDPTKSEITFTKHDEDKISPPKYLNDTVVSFFMQYYLDNKVDPHIKECVYVFNSFFFAKIKCLKVQQNEKGFKCASKWIKGVDIFDKDFLIMPVCEKEHWVLVIICYPSKTPSIKSQLISDEELYEPAVLVLNSSPGCAPAVKKVLQLFLKHQWLLERRSERTFSINNAKKTGIRLIFPKLPLQGNNYNCGVFILNYFYCFLKDPRAAYLRMYRKRDMRDWFKENDINISSQRRKMKELVNIQKTLWQKSNNDLKHTASDSQEVYLELSRSSSSSVDELVASARPHVNTSVIEIQ